MCNLDILSNRDLKFVKAKINETASFSNWLRSNENNLIYFRNNWVIREKESFLLV